MSLILQTHIHAFPNTQQLWETRSGKRDCGWRENVNSATFRMILSGRVWCRERRFLRRPAFRTTTLFLPEEKAFRRKSVWPFWPSAWQIALGACLYLHTSVPRYYRKILPFVCERPGIFCRPNQLDRVRPRRFRKDLPLKGTRLGWTYEFSPGFSFVLRFNARVCRLFVFPSWVPPRG